MRTLGEALGCTHRYTAALVREAGTLGHGKMLSRAVTCTPASPGTGSRVLGLGRTKDGSLLYNFLAGPSASTNSSSCTDTWSHSLPGQQQQHEEAS